ncbi:MAG TPA: divalent-cation tolerance protein CutA [Candidatus Methylacidiphilales bacterium]|jgi:periplasmic divalent cation tolerance protein|nr:divalent-cation tolerance protein CutA [Candidatus Methylacidiphilales bacterium]
MPFTPRLVFVTASSLEEARSLAQGILDQRLAACVNLIPGVESHYWWQGKLEKAAEVMLVIKSSSEQFEALAGFVRKHHSYECPEIVSVAPDKISPGYRSWWDEVMMKSDDGKG